MKSTEKTAQSQKHRLPAFIILPLLLLPMCILFAIDSVIEPSIVRADSCPPAIMVNDEIYYCRGGTVDPGPNEIEILGYIDSDVPINEMPKKNNVSNFPICVGQPYGVYEGEMCIYFDDQWHACEKK